MAVFIGGAWVYANGSLHLGHVSSLLSGDILARYFRLKGEKVLYVSGSDCNGTPITVRAKQEGVSPAVIANRYHEEFVTCFSKLGFSYDVYTRTDTTFHHRNVQNIFLDLLQKGLIYKKEVEQSYCNHCEQFLPDRYVEGICPQCHAHARGDQCDQCSKMLEPLDLLQRQCKLCGNEPTTRFTEHFYLSLSSFQETLDTYVSHAEMNSLWRENAISLTKRYLREGLQDRAVSRDLSIGVSVPIKGYEDKKIYVWIEAVAGYLTASRLWAEENENDDSPFWSKGVRSYYVHGKDNIPFHSVIWASILVALGDMALPTHIVSNEYVTLEKRKISTSKNWAVWMPDLLERYEADSIRYFMTSNAPENRDADFSWKEFIYSHNAELLGAYGNFVNRTLKFIEKSFESIIPDIAVSTEIQFKIETLYVEVGQLIEQANFKRALETVFEMVRFSNKYFDQQQPWKQINSDEQACQQTLADCAHLIINLGRVLEPFLPFSSKKIREMIHVEGETWGVVGIKSYHLIKVVPLFERIDVAIIEEERTRLYEQSNA
ncbi:methionine--tRNA ligase [Exiguobacterium mexicanum]